MDNLRLKRATVSDSDFAYQVKKLAFGKYVEQVRGWNEAEQRALHQKRFASQEFYVIQWSDIEVGVLAFVRDPDCLTVNQLFILPEYQGRGIGRACMMQIINEAATSHSAVRLRVLKVNSRAMAFFEGLGFERIGESDMHVHMERSP